jgi:hypothetical protein
MNDKNTKTVEEPPLVGELFWLVKVHRPTFKHERPFRRATGLMSFGRHTLTQDLVYIPRFPTTGSKMKPS